MEGLRTCHICNSVETSRYCNKYNHTLYKCNNCGFIFVYPTPKNLGEIYKKDYFQETKKQETGYTNYEKDKESMRHVFEKHLEKFSNLVEGRNIFDVGAATGYFLDIAGDKGWDTYGIEISKYAGNVAKNKGHSVSIGFLPESNIAEKMDIVTMYDVLEHVSDPREYLKSANNLLNNGGYIAINVPDISSSWARLTGKNWPLIVPPEHLSYFNPHNLSLLLNQTGFEVIETGRINKKFSLPYFFNMGYRWQGLKIWKYLADFFEKPFMVKTEG